MAVNSSPSPFETADEFIWSDGGSADLADDNAGRMIGNNGGFQRRGAGSDGRCEGCDYSIAGAGHIVNLACDGGNVKRFLIALAEQHAEFSQRNQQDHRTQL